MIPVGIGDSVRASKLSKVCNRRRLLNLVCMIKTRVAFVGSMSWFETNLTGGPIGMGEGELMRATATTTATTPSL
jgi:hypothetical protein